MDVQQKTHYIATFEHGHFHFAYLFEGDLVEAAHYAREKCPKKYGRMLDIRIAKSNMYRTNDMMFDTRRCLIYPECEVLQWMY